MKALSRNLQKEVLDCIQISCYEILLQDDYTILGKQTEKLMLRTAF